MQSFVYPAILRPDKDDGGFIVRFVDLPEAITQGQDKEDALREAADCLEEAVANRIAMDLHIPAPSRMKRGQHAVIVPAQTAAKAALSIAIKDAGITKTELAKRLGCDEKEVRRLLDPRHPSKLPRIEAALSAVGQRLIVGLQAAA